MGAPLDDQVLQARVLAFLGDPGSHRGATVRRIDTHASRIFRAAERALKIKRAIRLPDLDYSTLAQRKAPARPSLCSISPTYPESIVASWRSREMRTDVSRPAAAARRSTIELTSD